MTTSVALKPECHVIRRHHARIINVSWQRKRAEKRFDSRRRDGRFWNRIAVKIHCLALGGDRAVDARQLVAPQTIGVFLSRHIAGPMNSLGVCSRWRPNEIERYVPKL